MKSETKKVRTGGNVVGEVEVPTYENLDELIEKEDESRILSCFNNGNAVRIMGNERAKHTLSRIGKTKRFEIGYELLTEDEQKEIIGSIDKLKEVINRDEVQKRIDDYLAEQAGGTDEAASAEADEEEEE